MTSLDVIDPDVSVPGSPEQRRLWTRSRKFVRKCAVAVVLTAVTGLTQAGAAGAAEPINTGQGQGRHFFMIIAKDGFFHGEARVLQNGTEIVRLGGSGRSTTQKYSKQWDWRGHAGEQVEVTLTWYARRQRTWFPDHDQVLYLPADQNSCYREEYGKLSQVTDNCTST